MAICKKHPLEPAVGVCASCLRDRLLSLDSCVTPRSCPPSSVHQEPSSRPMLFGACPSQPEGKKAGFSVVSTLFGTPGGVPSPSGDRSCRVSDGQLPSLPPQRLDEATAVPPSFSSWLSTLFDVRGRRNKRPGCRTASTCDTGELASSAGTSSAATSGTETKVDVDTPDAPLRRRTCRFQKYRGMSPGSEQQEEDEELQHEEGEQNRAAATSFASGSSPSTSGGNHQVLPCATPARTLGRRNPAVVEAGFVVCFSPLVNARQHHHRRSLVVARDSGGAQDGEQHNPVFRLRPLQGQHPHQHHRILRHGTGGGGGVRLGPNRSRKLVDMGRFR